MGFFVAPRYPAGLRATTDWCQLRPAASSRLVMARTPTDQLTYPVDGICRTAPTGTAPAEKDLADRAKEAARLAQIEAFLDAERRWIRTRVRSRERPPGASDVRFFSGRERQDT